ncbi:hypothetical protein RclHR1_07820005 [Rhizophagus clarus]|uniref:Uncharacterized protein n=1 Tax=Rhizophagus clarus TaxID=94130 RepID=A0A2Z6SDA5_9GLOM|nr:hypothetical protein RclHR1_07820005 [Rhizophagus clarus]GES99045.1 hypothetical protein GLOIN_2v1530520 [Rhizophagus clarus]
MGTSGLTIVRERKAKQKNGETSVLGGPSESQYFYEYYIAVQQWHYGTWLVNFLCKFKDNLRNNSPAYLDTGLLAAKLIKDFMMSEYDARVIPFMSLEKLFTDPPDFTYIIITTSQSEFDNSIMLSMLNFKEIILTARPEKFLGKYEYYCKQMKENKKSFVEIDYGDDEVINEGYFSEDQLFIKFVKDIPFILDMALFL